MTDVRASASRRSQLILHVAATRRFAVVRDAALSNVGIRDRRTSRDDPLRSINPTPDKGRFRGATVVDIPARNWRHGVEFSQS
jgi:hypothetical protein